MNILYLVQYNYCTTQLRFYHNQFYKINLILSSNTQKNSQTLFRHSLFPSLHHISQSMCLLLIHQVLYYLLLVQYQMSIIRLIFYHLKLQNLYLDYLELHVHMLPLSDYYPLLLGVIFISTIYPLFHFLHNERVNQHMLLKVIILIILNRAFAYLYFV
ncbi:hypothetical protein IMG5_001190 [Ichthyophthirius multifiliis]|uniref:Transmembrane protein n=1 Tax=Ichthyophthirius multifiliis TaxID=5932 RepID=G0QIR0_ICHMU|nr:hypothetical protein IMG5_001190 [Ichthyophthirius multifiliis]EGR34890.1 hypothetical protein IMG5_001190 [Ichthyophthirius multifiliis]|eukprot:XP_004040194.1 hypothetical protein IMG5_001190 [Ichthyophthirius multifiliis]